MELRYSPEDERIVKSIHLLPPLDDGHKECVGCWCEPTLISKEDQVEVWQHKGQRVKEVESLKHTGNGTWRQQ